MKKRIMLALLLAFCMLLSACGGESTATEESKAVEKAAPTEEAEAVEEAAPLEEEPDFQSFIEEQISQGNYHDALSALVLWADEGVYEEDAETFDAFYEEILNNTGKDEPASGTELERTFKYQGGGLGKRSARP